MTIARKSTGPRSIPSWAVAAILSALVGGCASVPADHFYTLTSHARAQAGDPIGPSVVVAPAAVPDLLDRPQLVIFSGANRVVILEQQRWAEPLRVAIARVVAESLGRQLGGAIVSTRDETLPRPDCRVRLDVRRLDARPGGAVDLEALWTLTCAGAVGRAGRSVAREAVNGPGTDAVVLAEERAIEMLAHDLARALRETAPTPLDIPTRSGARFPSPASWPSIQRKPSSSTSDSCS